MLRNTDTAWGTAAKSLHWAFALLVAAQVPLGFWLSRESPQARITGDDSVLIWLEQFHHSCGFVILFIAGARLWWRSSNMAPAHPAQSPPYQVALAKLTHATLYVLMFVFPLSGWAASSVIGSEQFPVPINFFGFEMVPLSFLHSLGTPFNTFALYRDIHTYCWWAGGVLVSLHILAALYHHFVLKTDVLKRMMPGMQG
ncbi:MAG: cytochrome b [Rhodospirillaceae bacterium]|nr:cytochrome b [Rhodospirillaceae bacterium]